MEGDGWLDLVADATDLCAPDEGGVIKMTYVSPSSVNNPVMHDGLGPVVND